MTDRQSPFAVQLKESRLRAGISQRGLARKAAVNPAIMSRLESGDRMPSGPEQVIHISRALGLDENATDALLAAAGFWPQVVLAAGPANDVLLAVARVAASDRLDNAAKERFRRLVLAAAEQWLAG
jgi:transcriptional regulator with XRE-family HTH domain